ncbi:MAG: response regulator [Gemmatimonadetes bacterium]|nr:response regulator [Gemmatimonadota bacterium]
MSSDRRGVLVVDDSALIRRLVADIVGESGDFRVVGEAASGAEAIAACLALDPAVVTLDIEMPGLGGLETLGYLMSESPRPVVIVSGGTTRRGEDLVVQALELGAVDFVRKPSVGSALDVDTLRTRVLQALRAATLGHIEPPRVVPRRAWRRESPPRIREERDREVAAGRLLVVATSTGGPKALAELCAGLVLPEGTAGVIVQHMPPGFTNTLAHRLDEVAHDRVRECTDGSPLLAGEWTVLAGGAQWVIVRPHGAARVRMAPEIAGPIRPAADPLLASAVDAFGSHVDAVILTGMGRDGAHGAALVRGAGGRVLVQSPETAAIGGMPQAALDAAGADWCGPLDRLAAAISTMCASSPQSSRRA